MEASVDPQCRGPDWMPITPKTGSLFHAETQPRHDGPNAVMAHQSLDATAARSTTLSPQLGVDARAAIASVGFAMDLLNVVDQIAIGD